ncbi:MAG: hypothetical protein ACLFTE_00575 [Salinivenus sp.]
MSESSKTQGVLTPLPLSILLLSLLVIAFTGVAFSRGLFASNPVSAPVVTITATGLDFDAPDTIASGWTTFQLKNESGMEHFALIERIPDGVGLADHQQEVAPLFQRGFELLAMDEAEAASETFGQLPEWFSNVEFVGGPGLLGAGRTAQTTVELAPGSYLIECYVKTNGVFHSYNPVPGSEGMVRELTVTDERTGATAPTPTLELSISSEEGIQWTHKENLQPGEHTVAVQFKDQTVHGNFVGHDVHLARLDEDENTEPLAAWMDWTQPHGLETPAPISFVGGINEMPAGETGYLTVDLRPGPYAWVAEVPRPEENGMLQTFTVPERDAVSGQDDE